MVSLKKRVLFFTLIFSIVLIAAAFAYDGRILLSKDPSMIYFQLGKESFNNNDLNKALDYFQKAVEINPDFAEAYHNLGIVYYELGNHGNAITELEKAVGLNSNYEKAYYSLALIYYENNDFDNAIINLLKVIELNPENSNANFDLAVAYVDRFREKESSGSINTGDLEDLKAASAYYLKVVELDPDFPHASGNADIVRNVIGGYEEQI